MLEAVLVEEARAYATYRDPNDDIDPLQVCGPFAPRVKVQHRMSLELSGVRHNLLRLVRGVVPETIAGVESHGGYNAPHNARLNRLLADHLSGNLFDEQNPGRFHREPLLELLDHVESHLDASFLGVEPTMLALMFGQRLREYALVDQIMVHEIGRQPVMQSYRSAQSSRGKHLLPYHRE